MATSMQPTAATQKRFINLPSLDGDLFKGLWEYGEEAAALLSALALHASGCGRTQLFRLGQARFSFGIAFSLPALGRGRACGHGSVGGRLGWTRRLVVHFDFTATTMSLVCP